MHWYAVATKPNGECTAEVNLTRQGFEVFLPQIIKTRRHARKVEQVRRPLFAGYLFVQFDPSAMPWRAINGTIGVRHLLTNKGRPQHIQPKIIAGIRAHINNDGVIVLDEERLRAGEKVEVINGAMQGYMATILSADDQGRVRILMSIMGGDVISLIATDQLEKAS